MAKKKIAQSKKPAKPMSKPQMRRTKGGDTSTGKVTFSDLHITKVVDKSSPSLFL